MFSCVAVIESSVEDEFWYGKLDATMTNATKLKLVCLVLLFVTPRTSTAQLTGCANIELGPNVSVDCNDPCVTLKLRLWK